MKTIQQALLVGLGLLLAIPLYPDDSIKKSINFGSTDPYIYELTVDRDIPYEITEEGGKPLSGKPPRGIPMVCHALSHLNGPSTLANFTQHDDSVEIKIPFGTGILFKDIKFAYTHQSMATYTIPKDKLDTEIVIISGSILQRYTLEMVYDAYCKGPKALDELVEAHEKYLAKNSMTNTTRIIIFKLAEFPAIESASKEEPSKEIPKAKSSRNWSRFFMPGLYVALGCIGAYSAYRYGAYASLKEYALSGKKYLERTYKKQDED